MNLELKLLISRKLKDNLLLFLVVVMEKLKFGI